MVFKQNFKYLKNEKINFIKVILKLECLFYQNIYIISSYNIFVEEFWLKQIQKGPIKKNTPHFGIKIDPLKIFFLLSPI